MQRRTTYRRMIFVSTFRWRRAPRVATRILPVGRSSLRTNYPRRMKGFEDSCTGPSGSLHCRAAGYLADRHRSQPRAAFAGANRRGRRNRRPAAARAVVQISGSFPLQSYLGIWPGRIAGDPAWTHAGLVSARRNGLLSSHSSISANFSVGLDSDCDSLVWRWRSRCHFLDFRGMFFRCF